MQKLWIYANIKHVVFKELFINSFKNYFALLAIYKWNKQSAKIYYVDHDVIINKEKLSWIIQYFYDFPIIIPLID